MCFVSTFLVLVFWCFFCIVLYYLLVFFLCGLFSAKRTGGFYMIPASKRCKVFASNLISNPCSSQVIQDFLACHFLTYCSSVGLGVFVFQRLVMRTVTRPPCRHYKSCWIRQRTGELVVACSNGLLMTWFCLSFFFFLNGLLKGLLETIFDFVLAS